MAKELLNPLFGPSLGQKHLPLPLPPKGRAFSKEECASLTTLLDCYILKRGIKICGEPARFSVREAYYESIHCKL